MAGPPRLCALPVLFALLAVNGFFQAMIFPSLLRLTAQWWPSRWRGFQTGFLLAVAGASAVVAFAVSGWFIAHFGWVSAFRYPTLLTLVFALAYFVLVRERPEDVGRAPYTDHGGGSAHALAGDLGGRKMQGTGLVK